MVIPVPGRYHALALLIGLSLLTWPAEARDKKAQEHWPSIQAEELSLKEHRGAPGAHAIILYREMHSDHQEGYERHYYRIKILSEEGKEHANIEIPFLKGSSDVKDIRARTVCPGSTVANFTGTIFEKVVAKRKKIKFLAKTFTLPDVQVGCIIEYRYRIEHESRGTVWLIDDELFTQRARFSLRPREGERLFGMPENLTWNYFLPRNQSPQRQSDGTVLLETENIPAFEEEEFMPPERNVKRRVEFFYLPQLHTLLARLQQVDPKKYGNLQWKTKEDIFWKVIGMGMNDDVEEFIRKRKRVERAVAQIVAPGDSAETKLRKLYDWTQEIQNTGYDRPKTEKEAKRRKFKTNRHVEDVLKRRYGTGFDINRLFVALARAAGFRASIAWLATRSQNFFARKRLDSSQLNAHVAVVELDSKEVYLDPATRFCPFQCLPWDHTGVSGLRLDKNGGTFVKSPSPKSDDAVIQRDASLRLNEEGVLAGKLQLSFVGHAALSRRLDALEKDEAGRRESLEEEVKGWLPAGAEVAVVTPPSWEETSDRLVADFTVKIPDFAASTGSRLLLPVAVFHTTRRHPFEHAKRRYPVHFQHPYQEIDQVTVELPEGYQVESLPESQEKKSAFGLFEIKSENTENKLRLWRHLKVDGFYVPLRSYPAFRRFFSVVKTTDEEQAVLRLVETD